jgi:hypothetical protein
MVKLTVVFFQINTYKGERKKYCDQIYLVKNWILRLEASACKLDDLLIGARFLPTKLVAWESKDLKT